MSPINKARQVMRKMAKAIEYEVGDKEHAKLKAASLVVVDFLIKEDVEVHGIRKEISFWKDVKKEIIQNL